MKLYELLFLGIFATGTVIMGIIGLIALGKYLFF